MNPPTFISSVEENSLIGSSDNSSPTSTGEAQPIKRKRLTQACDACRKKKVKCSGEKPSCNNCTRLGTTCTYLPSTRKRGPRVGLVESLEKRLQQMEKLLKEQGFTDDMDDEQTSHPEKKQRSDSEDKLHSIPDNSYSTFLGDSVNFARANLQNHHNNHNHIHSNNNNNNNNNNHNNHNKFQRVSGAFDNSSQPSNSSYPQNDLNLLPDSQKASQMNQLPSSNGQMPRVMERQINNDNFREVKPNLSDPINVVKKVEEPLFFGKTSAKPGYIHHSELLCAKEPPSTGQTSTSSEDASPNIISPMSSAVISNIINGYPRLEIIEHLASCYFRHIDIMIPIFHEPTFMKQLRLNKVSSFLVFAMCAVSSRFATHPSIARNPPRSAGDQFAAVANTMIYQSFDYPSVEHVQALILLTLHLLGTCKGPKAWMYIGMAVRMAQEIGLHKVDETPMNTGSTRDKSETVFIQKEIRRRTFWSCFLLDRYASCAVGRPTLIDEDDCDVRLPCNEAIWNYDHPYSKSLIDEYYNEVHVKQDTRMTLTNNGLFACLVSVTALLGRVSHFVNRSKPSNSLPPWNPQSQFAMLAEELEMWYRSLSPHYTYSKERLRKLMTNGTGAIFASFHLLYHASVIVLNRPNTALSQDNGGIEACGFARASAERCSVAARAVSSICADILQHGFQSLCLFVLYPTFVTSTVLINDLYSPDSAAAAEAKKNLETCEEFLSSLEPYWAMGGKLLLMVKEIRKQREEKSRNTFNNPDLRNFEQTVNEVLMGTDSGLLAFWNRTANVVDNNLDNMSSVILPEQLLIPRWLDFFNDSSIANGSLSNLLRSSDPFSPRTRLFKKDKNSNEENSTEEDYFSQDITQYNSKYPPPVFNGYPIVDMSTINQNTYDLTPGRISPLNRPFKHWSTVNVTSDSMTEEPSTSDCRSSSTNASNSS